MTQTATATAKTSPDRKRNTRVVIGTVACYVAMLGLSFAAVPLYRIFCQVTGFAGTTQRAEAPSSTVGEKIVTIRFDSNINGGLGWKVKPVVRTMDVRVGENHVAFYRATNTTDRPIVGTASFNVAPDAAGAYFAKIECFCFTEQRLEPGQSVDMPVSFYVDPDILMDPDAKDLQHITLSYTFFKVDP
ncbi:MAG: cytochrome c oxidase assembly protein, partial [Pseudomonadota bacterium]